MPFPNTNVIPPQWQEHHAPTTENAMNATITFTRPTTSTPIFDEAAGKTTHPAATPMYDGPCRIHRSPRGGDGSVITVADRDLAIAAYTVVIPATATPVRVRDTGTVTTCPDTPALVGAQVVVTSLGLTSTAWQQDLTCEIQPLPTTR